MPEVRNRRRFDTSAALPIELRRNKTAVGLEPTTRGSTRKYPLPAHRASHEVRAAPEIKSAHGVPCQLGDSRMRAAAGNRTSKYPFTCAPGGQCFCLSKGTTPLIAAQLYLSSLCAYGVVGRTGPELYEDFAASQPYGVSGWAVGGGWWSGR